MTMNIFITILGGILFFAGIMLQINNPKIKEVSKYRYVVAISYKNGDMSMATLDASTDSQAINNCIKSCEEKYGERAINTTICALLKDNDLVPFNERQSKEGR